MACCGSLGDVAAACDLDRGLCGAARPMRVDRTCAVTPLDDVGLVS